MNPLTRYEPLVGRLDGLFDEFLRPALVWENNAAPQIRVDVKETSEAYTVAAELPGVKKDAIHVEIEGNEVTISAETRRENANKDNEKWLRTERFYGKTARRFALPQEIDEARANAKFADGVLELTLPKKAVVTGRKLEIN
ncbi:MAG TPA: Hsp20/alpha crystallin family protein [Usitatibacter sp.]|jgi:HSP20 family protein|nr:Hsp20/alpha crystallin family protein [Usitatibacter sp.]